MPVEIQPRISQTPPCMELEVRLCFLSLCQLPPTFSTFTAYPPPSLHLQSPFHHCLLLLSSALCASILPGRNQPWQPNSLSLLHLLRRSCHRSWHSNLAQTTEQFSTSASSYFPPGKSSCMTPVSFSLLIEDGCFGFSPCVSKLKSLPYEK